MGWKWDGKKHKKKQQTKRDDKMENYDYMISNYMKKHEVFLASVRSIFLFLLQTEFPLQDNDLRIFMINYKSMNIQMIPQSDAYSDETTHIISCER